MGTPAAGGRLASTVSVSLSNFVNMLVGIISRPSSITSQIPQALLNCPKTELEVSAHQVEYPAPKNVITIEFTTNKTGVFCVSLALLLGIMFELQLFLQVLFLFCTTGLLNAHKPSKVMVHMKGV